jgi:nucleotide-binding universal stress UspA family protein
MTEANDLAADRLPLSLVVGIDFGDASKRALTVAITTALERTERGRAVHIHLVHAMPLPADGGLPLVATMPPLVEDLRAGLMKLADELTKPLVAARGGVAPETLHVVTHLSYGDPAHEIVDVADRYDAELIIVGTHGRRGLSRLLLGSVAENVVRLSPTPVLVVRPVHAEEDVKIEPLCPDCAKARKDSNNEAWWCDRHSQHHPRPHGSAYAGASYDAAKPWGFGND